jgi:hypothetical protein
MRAGNRLFRPVLPLLAVATLLSSVPAYAQTDIADTALQQIQALLADKESRTPAQRKIDSQLLQAVAEQAGTKLAGVSSLLSVLPVLGADASGRVVVDMRADVTPTLLDAIAAAGGRVVGSWPHYRTLRAQLALAQLESIASLPDVSFIYPREQRQLSSVKPAQPEAPGSAERRIVPIAERRQAVQASLRGYLTGARLPVKPLVGSVQDEGDATHAAATLRSAHGYDGTGVKIGVISDSCDYLAESQASGNLGKVTVLAGQSGIPSTGEGTAMLEIVHDLAPGAELYFATADPTQAQFAANILGLQAAGCNIIIDDVFYYLEGVFQDGTVAQAVNTVTAAGVFYFSSAGNQGGVTHADSSVWEGDFTAGANAGGVVTTAGKLHRFSGATDYDALTGSGGPVKLTWADPLGASANDYDLFVLDSAGTAVLGSSTNLQTGTQDPMELAFIGVVSGNRVVVVQKVGAASLALHVNAFGGPLTFNTQGQTSGHSAAANAFSTAATPALSPGPYPGVFTTANTTESFSSDGPRRVFFDAAGVAITPGNFLFGTAGGTLRQKPDITAADGVTTSLPVGSFLNPFYGTSAAAPHAGAIAGLLKSAKPTLTNVQVRTALTSTALDIQAAGVDRDSGSGIVMAAGAFGALPAPAPSPVANLFVNSVVVTEAPGGNGNGGIEPGESGDVVITLMNGGAVAATSVSASVALTSPAPTGVSLLSGGPISYGAIAAGATGSNAVGTVRFHLAPTASCGQQIDFNLTLTYSGGPASPVTQQFSVKTGPPSITINETLDGTAPSGTSLYAAVSGLQSGRLAQDDIIGGCTNPKSTLRVNQGLAACPGKAGSANRLYDAYTFTNTSSNAQCVQASLTTSNTGACAHSSAGQGLQFAVYSGTYNPANVCTNYLNDPGIATSNFNVPPATNTMYFMIPAGTQYTIVVYELTSSTGVGGCAYTLAVNDAPNCVPGLPVTLSGFTIE